MSRARPSASEPVLRRLTRLHPRLIDLSLERIRRLLDALGRPEDRLPPVIHVAGTNGKGSVIAFLAAVLEAAGLSVHAYTSPHLVRFNERIVLGGRPIEDDSLADILAECERANRGEPITFFEITTAAGFLAMARGAADIALVETGLGGRFDATNVLDGPALSVITPVSRDHGRFLGETIAEIAFEKAGILKPGVTAVIGEQTEEAAAVIAARAAEIGAPLRRHGREWHHDAPSYRDGAAVLDLPEPGLFGPHQRANAALAAAAARALPGPEIAVQAIARGIAAARWPGRLQRLSDGVLARAAGPGRELWLDGGHNAAAGAALAAVARDWGDRPLDIVVGHLANRPPAEFLAPLAGHVRSLRAVPIPGGADCHDPDTLAAAGAALGVPAQPHAGVPEAVAAIAREAPSPSRILICGSLYLVGSVLARETP